MTGSKLLESAAVAAVLVLAFVLRFGWVGISAFSGDEASIGWLALNMLHNGQIITLGKLSSVGIPFFPASLWIFLLPFAITSDPLGAVWFVSALSFAAVVGVWALVRANWGVWAGLTAALFMAASPFAVFYGRSIWEPNLLPPFALLWAASAYFAAARQNRLALGLHAFLAGFVLQIHFSAAPLAVGTLYLFLRFRWWKQFVPVLVGAAFAVLTALPYVANIACCHPDVLARFQQVGGGAPSYDLSAAQNALHMALGIRWEFFALGGDLSQPPLTFAAGALMLLGAGGLLWRLWRRSAEPSGSRVLLELTLLWLLLSPLFFIRHTSPNLMHYQLVTFPALAVMAGAGAYLLRHRGGGVAAAMAVVAALWAGQIVTTLDSAARTQPVDGALAGLLQTSRGAIHSVPTDRPLLYYGFGDDPLTGSDPAIHGLLMWGRDHRLLDAYDVLFLPPYPVYLMVNLPAIYAWEGIEALGIASEVWTYPRRPPAPPYMIAAYDGRDPAGFTPVDPPVRFASGIQLEGWRIWAFYGQFRLMTLYRVLDAPPPGTIQQFTHLRAAGMLDAAAPFRQDDMTLYARHWQTGDRLVVFAVFPDAPPGDYWIDVGTYMLETLTRFPRLDGQGDALRLGPVDWAPNPP